jgi:hypothetical protein
MATKEIELDVDFIGGQEKLTVEEERAITEFLKKHRNFSKQLPSPKRIKTSKKTKATA